MQIAFFLLGVAIICNIFIGSLLYLLAVLDLPDVATLSSYQPAEASLVVDAKGRELNRFYRENRRVVRLTEMPVLLPKAFVAAEDGRFYQHGGVDGWSVLRAVFNNFRSGRRSQGGSTITQQVARALLLSPEKTYIRKLREAVLACRMDRILTKNEVLHLYLNQIYFGEGAYGVEAAAQVYFGKPVGQLTLAEMSILAGLPQAPSRYSPLVDLKSAKARQRYVLNRMAEDGYISADQARAAYGQELVFQRQGGEEAAEGYFIEAVRQYVESRYGSERLLAGGLTIRITMDRELQKAAALAVAGGVGAWRERHAQASEIPQGALVALEVGSGRVLALVGGRDFRVSEFNRATQSRRQPGSVFKPFIYAVALNGNFSPTSLIDDKPLALPGGAAGVWRPSNYDGKFLGPVTLRTGLIQSRNIVTIKLLQAVGVDPVIKLAAEMGITSPLANNLSLALGTSGVSLLELTNAYGVFADGGIYHQPVLVTQILDRQGRTLESSGQESNRVLPARTAYQVTNLLQGVIKEGTGHQADGLEGESAGKTGTTDKSTDAWFIGYTPELVAGVWLGFDRQEHLGEVESGGKLAAPVWLDFMQATRRLHPPTSLNFPVPDDVVLMAADEHGNSSGLPTALSRPQPSNGGAPSFFRNLWDRLRGK
ncbi:MAG: PBP1A family penicillin-binding protein [Desulfobulbaceae bacterium]|nr:PBP1A family penicillin-binding protein [Desulfobulbaceae bacterium]